MKNGKLAHLSTFASDRRGNFAVMGAVALFPMLMVAGMAMDTGRAFSEKTRLEDALDAAVLSAGRAYSTGRIAESDLKDYLTRILHANFHDKDGTGGTRRIEDYNLDEENGIIFASAISDFEIAFKIIGGGEPLELKASSAASFGGTNAEVAFTLDVTGSMGAGKNKDLQEALTGAIDLLLAANGDGEERIRISLIPYSKSVRVGEFLSDYIYIDDGTPGAVAPAHVSVPDDDESASAGGSGDGLEDGAEVDSTSEINSKYIGCATERKKDIDNPTDNGPDYGMVNLDGRVLEFGATAIFVVNCPSEAETMVPLTSDRDTLMTTADSLGHRGSTAGHVGIQWAWYTLSPKWASYPQLFMRRRELGGGRGIKRLGSFMNLLAKQSLIRTNWGFPARHERRYPHSARPVTCLRA